LRDAKSGRFPFHRCNLVAQFGNEGKKGFRFRLAYLLQAAFDLGNYLRYVL
jgi:hypothetical protein